MHSLLAQLGYKLLSYKLHYVEEPKALSMERACFSCEEDFMTDSVRVRMCPHETHALCREWPV